MITGRRPSVAYPLAVGSGSRTPPHGRFPGLVVHGYATDRIPPLYAEGTLGPLWNPKRRYLARYVFSSDRHASLFPTDRLVGSMTGQISFELRFLSDDLDRQLTREARIREALESTSATTTSEPTFFGRLIALIPGLFATDGSDYPQSPAVRARLTDVRYSSLLGRAP